MADDGMTEEERAAYEAARALIAKVKRDGGRGISFESVMFRAMTRIPGEIVGLKTAEFLNLDKARITDLTLIRALKGLQSLSIDQTGVTDLTPIRGLTGLLSLSLDQTGVTDLTPIRDLTGLQTLSLNQTGVTDLTPLRDLTGLQTLSLAQTGVTDLTPIRGLTGLQRLTLTQTGVTDLTPLRDLTGLQRLWLDQTGITDLTPIGGLTGLRALYLNHTSVSELTPISGLTGLLTLWLAWTRVTDLTPIRSLTGLRTLSLDRNAASDLTPIRDLTALQSLWLDQSGVTDLRPLIRMKNLGEGAFGGLWFDDTPVVRLDETLARTAKIKDAKRRAKETLAYLKTLPPWPEPLPWLEETAPAAKPAKPPRPSIRTPQKQIAFLLETASVTKMQAADLAKGIRLALANVSVLPGTNRLPDALQSMLDLAEVLDRLAASNLTPAAPDREAELKARIAELEQTVATLTAALADETKAKEAAEARANALETDKGFWTNYKSATGKALGYGQVAIMGTAIPAGIIYMLGPSHPFVRALLDLLTK